MNAEFAEGAEGAEGAERRRVNTKSKIRRGGNAKGREGEEKGREP